MHLQGAWFELKSNEKGQKVRMEWKGKVYETEVGMANQLEEASARALTWVSRPTSNHTKMSCRSTDPEQKFTFHIFI